MDRIGKLFDSLWKSDSRITAEVAGPLLRNYQLQAEQALLLLEEGLEGEADTAQLQVLFLLAELAAFTTCGRFHRAEQESSGRSAEEWMGAARSLAGRMGTMFLDNCDTQEREIREVVIDFA